MEAIESIIEFVKTYGSYIGLAVSAVLFYLWDKNKAMTLVKEMMLAAARLLRKGYLENTDQMKAWVVSKYSTLPGTVKLFISEEAWGKLVDYVAEKIKDYCAEDEAEFQSVK